MPPLRLLLSPFRGASRAVRALGLVTLLAAGPAATPAGAATRASGVVLDQQSGQPVAGAIVAAEGTRQRATTGEDGRFTLAADREFAALVVTRLGYERRIVTLSGDAASLSIELVRAPLLEAEIGVTGRAVTRTDLDEAASTGTLTREDLQRADGLTLENSINTLPGVQMQSRTPWGGAHIQIRGYYPNYSQNSNGYGYQAFLDDIPLTDATGLTIQDDVDYSTLGRVEVINGPASSRFGSAIGGTVQFWTARPAPGTHALAQQLVGGSDGLFRTNSTWSKATATSSTVLAYGHQTYDSFRPNSGSRKDFARWNGEYAVAPNQTIATTFAYTRSHEQIAGEIDLEDLEAGLALDNPLYAKNKAGIEIESERVGFTHAARLDPRFDVRSTLYATTQTMSQPFAHGFSDYNRFTFGARSALGVKTAVQGVPLDGAVGASVQRTNFTQNGYFNPDPTVAGGRVTDQQNYGLVTSAFTEWNAALPADVVATVGGQVGVTEFGYRNMFEGAYIGQRGTHVRAFDPKFLPRASVLKKFGDAVSAYASVGTGYTPPSLTNIVNSDGTVNESLKPERAIQYEVGSKGVLFGDRLTWSLALFDLDIRDKLVSQTQNSVTSTVNVGEQRNRGVELGASALVLDDPEAPITLVRPWMSWTYSDFTYVSFKSDNTNNANTVDFSGRQAARSPKHVMNLGLDVTARCGGYLFASYQHVDREFFTFDEQHWLPPYRLVGAKLGWRHAVAQRLSLDASAGGDNLTGSHYYRYVFIGPSYARLAQPKDGGTGDGYVIPGPYDPTWFANVTATWSF